jgi:hypothetical protein
VRFDRGDRAAELQIVGALARSQEQAEGVAERQVVARHVLITDDVGPRDQRVAERVVLGHEVRVGWLLEVLLAELEAGLVDLVVARDPVVSQHEVPVVAVQLHAARLVGDAADAEVLHLELLVDRLELEALVDADEVVQAGEPEDARHRAGGITGEVGKRSLGAEQRDVVLVDVLERQEIVGLVTRDGSTQSEAELVASEVLGALLELTGLAQRVAAVKTEDAAADVIAPRLGDDRQGTAGRAPDLGIEPVVDDPELGDGILAEPRAGEPERLVGVVHAVDDDCGLGRVAGRTDQRRVADEPEAAALALDAGGDERQILKIPVGDR